MLYKFGKYFDRWILPRQPAFMANYMKFSMIRRSYNVINTPL